MSSFDTTTTTKPSKRSKKLNSEAKAAAKAKKLQQDDMESLQITFYEIENWIEKTSPVLNRMTKELDKASKHFNKKQRTVEERHAPILQDLSLMQWSLSFQPNNSMRLETNIKSVEQLVEAVQKIKIMTEQSDVPELSDDHDDTDSSSSSTSSALVVVDPSIEYWNIAMYRRPNSCLEKYKHCDMNLSRLTEDVSPTVLWYICQTYWDCLHPNFSADWNTFWERSGDAARNQVRIDSGLAMVFLHIIRHDRNACANAHAIAYYYYDRAREALMDYFDSPDIATIETLLNLSMFCVLCKRHSQSRIYIGLAYRMMHQLNIHQLASHSTNKELRKKYLKLYMVLYYNDMMISVYSGEPAVLDDCDINFYDMLGLNQQLEKDDKTIAKETFFVHTMELAKIGKRIQQLVRDYQGMQHHHSGTLPLKWVKKVQEMEIALSTWFDRLPHMYRVESKPTASNSTTGRKHNHRELDATQLQEQSSLLLMLQYQTQWIQLHKTFLSPNMHQFKKYRTCDDDTHNLTPSPLATTPYQTQRSYHICTDAANRIVVMSELITNEFDWCVCQQFINCIYQASTVYCKSVVINGGLSSSKAMIHRITTVLAASKINYQGLPDDLTVCLNDFLATNNVDGSEEHTVVYNDKMFNSPGMHEACMKQHLTKPLPSLNKGSPSEAMFSYKMLQSVPMVVDLEPNAKNWRCKFSSSNIHKVM